MGSQPSCSTCGWWVGAPRSSRYRPAGCSPPALGVTLPRAGRGGEGRARPPLDSANPDPSPLPRLGRCAPPSPRARPGWYLPARPPGPEGSIAGSRGSDLAPRFCRWSRSRLAATLLRPGLELRWGFSAPEVRMREQGGEDTLSWLGPGDIAALRCWDPPSSHLIASVLSRPCRPPARGIAAETGRRADPAGPGRPAEQPLCAAPVGSARLSLSFSYSNASECAYTPEISR